MCLFTLIIKIEKSLLKILYIVFYIFFPFQIIDSGIRNIISIAIDWVGQNLYWSAAEPMNKLEVSQLDGSFRTVLFQGNGTYPRFLALDPREG